MLRTMPFQPVVLLTCCLSVTLAGCSSSLLNTAMLKTSSLKPSIMDGHGTEQRIITQFTDALGEDNEAAFRKVISTRFEQRAMRAKDSYKDLEILSLPKTDLEIVESKEISPTQFETVAKSEEGTKYQFILVRDEVKRRWTVDDVMLRQQKKGTRATKSSVEVMDLLLTIREFLQTWQGAERTAVLQALSTELRTPLEKLPEPWLQQMIARVSAECESEMARRPQAQMNESDAVVKMPSKNGFLLLKVARQDEQWLVSDIEVVNRKSADHPGSILRQARAMNSVTDFLTAYNKQDLTLLKKHTEPKFFQSSLSVGDLSLIPMPAADHAPDDFEIQSFAGQLTVMIPDKEAIVRIDLTTHEVANAKDDRKRPANVTVEAEFIIADVTIYDRQTQQQRNLRSAFTAPARAMLFLSALQTKDLPILRQTSARSLSEVSWDRIDPTLVSLLPLTGIPAGDMTLQSSKVVGEVTELEFLSASGKICIVLLRDENGSLKVEDVQYPDAAATVASLKTQVMLSVPVIELAHAWKTGNLDSVKRISSTDFNRLVWSNMTTLPGQFDQVPELLQQPVQRSRADEQRAIVELAEPGNPAVTVALLRENTAWVIDEISMPQADGTRLELRKSLRMEIARQFLVDPSGGIQQAHYTDNSDEIVSGIVQASGTSVEKPKGNLTLQSYGKPAARSASLSPGMDMTPGDVVPPKQTRRDETGTLHFGPEASTKPKSNPSQPVHSSAAEDLSILLPAPVETQEHGGVVYFKGDKKAAQPAATKETAGASKSKSSMTDLSENPIEIPME